MTNGLWTGESTRLDFATKVASELKWDIGEIADLFADVLEDANAHSEAHEVRNWVAAGCPKDGLAFVQRNS